MKISYKLVLVGLIFFLISCFSNSSDDALKKTFSCKMNGNLWIAESRTEISGYVSNASMNLLKTGNTFRGFLNAFNDGSFLQIVLNDLRDTGLFPLIPNDSLFKGTEFTDKDGIIYKAVSDNQSFLRLTQFDTAKAFVDSLPSGVALPEVIGSFNIIVRNADGKTINITDGKFDLSLAGVHKK